MTIREQLTFMMNLKHDDAVRWNREIFFGEPPTDGGIYVYTYYAGPDPIYHGFTADAPARALAHWKHAPWASWVDGVRYRSCRTVKAGRKLERRLQVKVPSMCHDRITRTHHDSTDPVWNELDEQFKINHVKGHCRLPGGYCDINTWLRDLKKIQRTAKIG